jgi:hypothetical protein
MSYASEEGVLNAQWNAAVSASLPSVLYKPSLFADGTQWCALYGDDLQSGVAGFGDTPAAAMSAFDAAWTSELAPAARLKQTTK